MTYDARQETSKLLQHATFLNLKRQMLGPYAATPAEPNDRVREYVREIKKEERKQALAAL
jgi:hypothetical protein